MADKGIHIQGVERAFKFRMVIEGSMPADSMETAHAFLMANVSLTAILGQLVKDIRVAAQEEDIPQFNDHGVRVN